MSVSTPAIPTLPSAVGRIGGLPYLVLVFAALVAVTIAGGAGAAAMLVFIFATTLTVARRLSIDGDRPFVLTAVTIAFLGRALFAALLDVALIVTGRGGALFLDDAGYVSLAVELSRAWQGQVVAVNHDPSVDHNYVRLAAALFSVLGPNVMALKLVNVALGTLSALVVYRTIRSLGLSGARAALLLMLFFPSLVLWSSLTLKDTYVLFFAVTATWAVVEFTRTRRYVPWYPLIVVSLLVMENVRPYLFVILVLAWPMAVLIASEPTRRWVPTGVTTALAALLLASTSALNYLNPSIVTAPVYIRHAMALGARSGFVEPHPVVRARPGDRYVVTVPGHACASETRVVTVGPGTELIIETADATSAGPDQVLVRPCDIVVVADVRAPLAPDSGSLPTPAAAAPAPPDPLPLVLSTEARNIVSVAPPSEEGLSIQRGLAENVAHLPIGILYVVGAPFPVAARTLGQAATIPEMLLWYLTIALALSGLVALASRRHFGYAYGILVLLAVGLVLSLVEGNVGTLVRHRAMLIPFAVTLAAIGFCELRRVPRSWRDFLR